MKLRTLFIICAIAIFFGCKDDEPCIPEVLSADVRIFKSNERCGDLGLPWEASFGVKFSFDYSFTCDKECSNKTIVFDDAFRYVKHVSGTIDTAFSIGINGGTCMQANSGAPNFYPSVILENEVGDPGPIVYELGDTIVVELRNPVLCFTDNEGRCNFNSKRIPLDLPDYIYEYILQPEDFDCD
jgi:hypothetical protein